MFKILFPIIMIAAAITGFFVYTKPMYATAKANDQELIKITEALDKAKQLSDIRNQLNEKYKNIPKEDLDRIKKMIPDSVENIGLIIDLNNIANAKGVELLNPSISGGGGGGTPVAGSGASSDGKKYGSITLAFGVTTTYDKFLDFIKELENTLRLVDITGLSFPAPDEKTGISTFSITMQTYWLK